MLQLSDREWAEFKIGELLTLKVAKSNDKGKLEVGTVPFVGRSNDNNGLQGFYDAPNVTRGKCITLGMVGTFRAFWQENDFAASQNILTLRAPWLNRNTALFICNIIEIAIKGRYSYGNSIKAGTFWDTILNLPVDDNGQPDYDFMEQYIAEREPDYSWATQCIEPNAELSLTDREWAEFRVGDLFNIKTGKAYNKNKINVADKGLRHISRATSNHGIDCYINLDSIDGIVTYEGNCVTVSSIPYTDGTCAFYQDKIFCCGVGVNIITHELMTPELGQFLCTCINHAVVGKYGMARSLSINMLKDEIINLPITQDGTPDYDFMERYIKSLPFSKVLEAQ